MSRSADGFERWLLAGLFVLSLGFALWAASVGWHHAISDQHGFRQSQTALTAEYMVRGGPLLRYETPVLGPPWTIPFELPVFQWIVAAVTSLLGVGLVSAGRLVNEAFFYLCLLAGWAVLGELQVRPRHRLVFLGLVLLSPVYLFWSRTFMLESTALFFALGYLLFALRYLRRLDGRDAALGCLAGALATMVKGTTFLGVLVVFAVAALGWAWTRWRQDGAQAGIRAFAGSEAAWLAVLTVVPLAAAMAWVHYTDVVKALSPAGAYLTSAKIEAHNFGTLQQRLEARPWQILWERTLPDAIGSTLVLGVLPLGMILAGGKRKLVLAALAPYAVTFLVFINLHTAHNYYGYANALFLIAAVAWCVVGLLERGGGHRVLAVVLLALCALASVSRYSTGLYRYQQNNDTRVQDVGLLAGRLTLPEDVVIGFGLDWSSELPFYSGRRGIAWPKWLDANPHSSPMRETLDSLGTTPVGAVVACGRTRRNTAPLVALAQRLQLATQPRLRTSTCDLWLPAAMSNEQISAAAP